MSAIKPPDGKPGTGPLTGSGGATGTAGGAAAERAGASFRDALEQAGAAGKPAGQPAADSAAGVGRADALAELAQAVRSGALLPEQAVAQLLDRAVAGIGSKLSEAQRLELTAVLREALENDPALAELRKAIG
jgi:hypothetical protein